MLIIVEGPDGVGKTTLIEQLIRVIEREEPGDKVEVLHKGPPTQHPLNEYEVPLFGYRPGRGHHLICDRWHVGEWVYPEVLGRPSLATKAIWYHTEMFLMSRGAVVFYPQLPLDLMKDRVAKRGDDLVAVHQLARIQAGYDYVATRHLLPWRSWLDPDPTAIVALARHRDRMSQRLSDYTTYIGPPRPERLLLGDVRNATYDGDPRPAFMPYRSTSGAWLLSNLRPGDFHGLGIMNACDVDDALIAQYTTFDDVPTVALGIHAHGKMNGTGTYHNGVPHPQYIRRFHTRQGEAYAAAIGRAFAGEEMIKWRPVTSV